VKASVKASVVARQPVLWSVQDRKETSVLDLLFRRERGQGLVEYALIIALIAVVVIGILILLGPAIGSIFSQISKNL